MSGNNIAMTRPEIQQAIMYAAGLLTHDKVDEALVFLHRLYTCLEVDNIQDLRQLAEEHGLVLLAH